MGKNIGHQIKMVNLVLCITLNFYFIPLFYSSVSLNFIMPYTHSYTHSHIHTRAGSVKLVVGR